MKNKVMLCGLLIVVQLARIYAVPTEELRNAYKYGAEAKLVYRVVNDKGVPVSNATAHVWFRSYGRKQDNADWYVQTDTNGMFVVAHRLNEKFSCSVYKDGYYQSRDERFYFDTEANTVKDGRWQPYGEVRTVVLKRIINPIPIRRSRHPWDFSIPAYDEWLGFDFERFAFVKPYGEGKVADVLMRFALFKPGDAEYHMSMELSFTNHPYAGAYLMKKDSCSEMAGVYEADTNAVFSPCFRYSHDRLPGKRPIRTRLSSEEYLVFRTRTVLDDKGRLVSANYGKLYGELHFVGPRGLSLGQLDFNLKPNDTNLEDAETARKSRLGYKQQLEFERRRKAGK